MNALTKVIYTILRSKYDIKMAPRGAKKPNKPAVKKGKKKGGKRPSSKGSSSSMSEESDDDAFELQGKGY